MGKSTKVRPKGALAGASVLELYSEIERRKSHLLKLVRRYERLVEQTNALRAKIEASGGFAGGSGLLRRPRARNRVSLATLMQTVLAGKELSVDELTSAVIEKGYKSTSPNLRAIVNKTLITNAKFKRVSRGIYANRPQAGAPRRG